MSGSHPFIPPQPAVHVVWVDFERALADALTALAEDEYLIVGSKRRNHYVQFAGQGAFGMRVEAVSNAYLQQDERLSTDDESSLVSLGWALPTHHPGEPGRVDGSANYFVDAAAPVPAAAIARLAVTTLRVVFRVRHPGHLQYVAFTRRGESIRFPGLRVLRREPTRHRPAAERPVIVGAVPGRVM